MGTVQRVSHTLHILANTVLSMWVYLTSASRWGLNYPDNVDLRITGVSYSVIKNGQLGGVMTGGSS